MEDDLGWSGSLVLELLCNVLVQFLEFESIHFSTTQIWKEVQSWKGKIEGMKLSPGLLWLPSFVPSFWIF